jgi:hypothetical protein
MVIENDQPGRLLQTASTSQCALFASSCVERGSGAFFLATADNSVRTADRST